MLTEAWEIENAAWALAKLERGDGLEEGDGPETVRADVLSNVTSTIVDFIEGTPATTLEGLQVKLRAIMWCRSGDPITTEDLAEGQNPAVETRLLAELLNDLSTMGARV